MLTRLSKILIAVFIVLVLCAALAYFVNTVLIQQKEIALLSKNQSKPVVTVAAPISAPTATPSASVVKPVYTVVKPTVPVALPTK